MINQTQTTPAPRVACVAAALAYLAGMAANAQAAGMKPATEEQVSILASAAADRNITRLTAVAWAMECGDPDDCMTADDADRAIDLAFAN